MFIGFVYYQRRLIDAQHRRVGALIVGAVTHAGEGHAEAGAPVHTTDRGLEEVALDGATRRCAAPVQVTVIVMHRHLHLHDGARVTRERDVDDSIGHLVGEFVGVPGQHGFGEAHRRTGEYMIAAHGQFSE